MRTTLALDDDVHEIASHYAAGRGLSLSAAINEVVRSILTSSEPTGSILKTAPNGLRVIAANGRTITPEMIKQALEDDAA